MKKLLGCWCVVLLSCGPRPAGNLDENAETVTVLPPESHQDGAPATGSVTYAVSREALAPLTLTKNVAVDAVAATDVTVTLPVDLSTQGVWARAWLPDGGWLEIAGERQWPSPGALVFFPLDARALTLRAEKTQQIALQMLASIDSAGGGFDVLPEAPISVEIPQGDGEIDDVPHSPTNADDTMLRLTHLELTAATDTRMVFGACGSTAPLRTFDVVGGVPFSSTELLPAGDLCTQSTGHVSAKLEVLGRVRRFSETALRPVTPVTVLDTSTGVGTWLGAPAPGQRLDFDLHGLTGFSTGANVLLRVDASAPVSFGACSQLVTRAPGESVLLPSDAPLCVETTTQAHVRVTLLAVTAARTEETGVCTAPTALPACNGTTMLERLNCLPGVTATAAQMTPLPPGASQFLLHITQPVDHFRPDGPTFKQRVLLTVRDEDAPMVMLTTGYELFGYFSEPATEFATNQIEVEHRFFKESTPDPRDYSTLTIMQSAWDSHRIVEALRPIFTKPWLTTGASKGGMTALYHRRFFPCDVEASAPYVTPLSLGLQDARYGPWLKQLGGPMWENCRGTFEDLEIGIIGNRAQYASTLQGTYELVGSPVNALWMLTGQPYWSMFQSGTQADPDEGCPAYEPYRGSPQFGALVDQYASYGSSYSDQAWQQAELDAYSYQTQNELGSPGGNRAHLEQFGPIPELPDPGLLLFANGNVAHPEFEARAMTDVRRWLQTHGERFVFVYGGFDPWSGGRVDSTGAQDTFNYLVEGGSHGSQLSMLPDEQQTEAFGRISAWLGVQRVHKRGKAAEAQLPTYRDFMHLHPL